MNYSQNNNEYAPSLPGLTVGGTLGLELRIRELQAELALQKQALEQQSLKEQGRHQNALNSRNEFVSMVSHDLKNPLSAILLNTGYILRTFKKQKETEMSNRDRALKKQIEALDRSAQQMNHLISDFLDLARIEAGKFTVDKKPYRVQSLLQDAIELTTPLALEKSIELTLTSTPSSISAVFDRERTFQVIFNLLKNAIKRTAPKGQVRLGTYVDRDELVFVVQDAGPAIPSHEKLEIFDNSRRSAGMGLCVSKGIVEAHGGRIWVESSPGEGSAFYFSLPHA